MSFFAQIRTHKVRFVKSFSLFFCFIAHGLVLGIMGPTMMDMAVAVGTTIDKVTYTLIARAGGFAVGSFFMGFLYSKVNVLLSGCICEVLSAVVLASVPYWTHIYTLTASFFILGSINGFMDAAVNVYLIDIWGKENPPFMQTLHFCYGVGALVSPLIARPFLLPSTDETIILNSFMNSSHLTNVSTLEVSSFLPSDVQLIYPYLIIAGFFLFVSSVFLVMWRLWPENEPHPSRLVVEVVTDKDRSSSNPEKGSLEKNDEKRKYKLMVVILMSIFLHLYCGVENTFGSFISPFAVKSHLHLSQQTGALISSIFWIAFTFFRMATIFYIDLIGAERNIIANVSVTLFAMIIMVPFGNNFEWALWTGSCLMGLGLSSTWASVFGYLEEYMPVTSQITSVFIIASCFGQLTVPAIISPFIEETPEVFLYMSIIYVFGMVVLFAAACLLCRYRLKKA